jgi:hypothetical protein
MFQSTWTVCLINCAFVGQKNFDIIEMQGATKKMTSFVLYCIEEVLLTEDSLQHIISKL